MIIPVVDCLDCSFARLAESVGGDRADRVEVKREEEKMEDLG